MNLRTPIKFLKLIALARNPWMLVADRLGVRKTPYRLRLWDGTRIELRPGRGDLTAFRESWLQADYFPPGVRLRSGQTVIDVGANIGCFTLRAARAVGPSGRVIAVEPDAETFAQLRRNLALSRLENVIARRVAVAGQSGAVQWHRHPNALYSSIYENVDGRTQSGRVEEVAAVTLEQLLDEEGVSQCHYLKLDCEGAEHAIVRTLAPAAAGRIRQIGMELHEVAAVNTEELFQRLEEYGFTARRRGAIAYFRKAQA